MKKLTLLLLFPIVLYAQEEEEAKQFNRSIYGELGLNGLSVNYERIFYLGENWQMISRACISYVPSPNLAGGWNPGHIAIPFEFTAVITRLEFGIGLTPNGAHDWNIVQHFRIGYRSVDDSGLLFRIAFTPAFVDGDVRL
ncbi:MAG: hypothetical protein IH946_08215 [Bacteroidetes bacterium]|nr:hypothetical protein [Bacteroidota bacterium]